VKKLLAPALAVCAIMGIGAPAAMADRAGVCDGQQFTQALSSFNDHKWYTPAQSGAWSFEGGASLQDGTLSLPAGSTVTTSPMCVSQAYTSFRVLARGSGQVSVDVLYVDGGRRGVVNVGSLRDNDRDGLGRRFRLASGMSGSYGQVAFRLTAVGGGWTVDDIFVDPYFRG